MATGTNPSIETRRAKLTPFDFKSLTQEQRNNKRHPLFPIYQTDGLVLQYTPSLNENVSVNYDSFDVQQSNESFNIARSTSNRTISVGNVVFTCNTPYHARYAIAALHFMRTYTLFDQGVGRTARPPSPMYFSAFGSYVYNKIPCLLEGYGVKLSDPEMDAVPVVNPESQTAQDSYLELHGLKGQANGNYSEEMEIIRSRLKESNIDGYTWLPIKLEFDNISLKVQHTPLYWKTFDLDKFRSGELVKNTEDYIW